MITPQQPTLFVRRRGRQSFASVKGVMEPTSWYKRVLRNTYSSCLNLMRNMIVSAGCRTRKEQNILQQQLHEHDHSEVGHLARRPRVIFDGTAPRWVSIRTGKPHSSTTGTIKKQTKSNGWEVHGGTEVPP